MSTRRSVFAGGLACLAMLLINSALLSQDKAGQAARLKLMVPANATCGATRVFHWKDFDVLINEVTAHSGGNPGLVGWGMGASSLGLKTDKGIGVGSTLRAVKAA